MYIGDFMARFIMFFILFLILLIIINSIWSRLKFKSLINTECLSENILFIDDIKINYIKKGTGPPLLMLHGFMNSLHFFSGIIDELAKNNTVYAIDIICFGASDKRPYIDYSKKSMAKLAKKFMDSQNIRKFNVLGHSMGGEVALHVAYYYPKNVNKLILVSSAGYVKTRKPFYLVEKSKWFFYLFSSHFCFTYSVLYIILKLAIYNKKYFNKKMLDDIFIQSQNIPFETFYKLSLQNNHTEIGHKAHSINLPSLLIWGRNDWIVPLKYGKRMHDDIKNSKLIIFDSCGHIPFLENRDEFLNQVKDFLSQ
jgi:pimeloyl-ACP methyl ester carboxylesterase